MACFRTIGLSTDTTGKQSVAHTHSALPLSLKQGRNADTRHVKPEDPMDKNQSQMDKRCLMLLIRRPGTVKFTEHVDGRCREAGLVCMRTVGVSSADSVSPLWWPQPQGHSVVSAFNAAACAGHSCSDVTMLSATELCTRDAQGRWYFYIFHHKKKIMI